MKIITEDTKLSGCNGKVRFTSQQQAETTAHRASVRNTAPILAYKCKVCHFWHLGSSTSRLDTDFKRRRRELREETGIVADGEHIALRDWHLSNVYEIYPVWRHRYAPGVTHNTEHVFGLCVPAGTPVRLAPREHTALQWLPWREAADRCFSPSNAEAVLHLADRITGSPNQ